MSPASPSAPELQELWAELGNQQDPGVPGRRTRRVIAGSRHDCFVAVDFPARRRLLSVVTHDPAPLPGLDRRPLTSGVLLAVGSEPTSGRPTVDMVLRDKAHSDIFTALVADLLNALACAGTEGTAGELLLARLDDWQRMLAAVNPKGMSPEHQRGLFGELTVLGDVLLPVVGAQAILAWTGPDQRLQDFQFPNAAIEVKTVSGNNAYVVRVTNERQLDNRVAGLLFLVSIALDARDGGPGLSLPELVGTLRIRVRATGRLAEFDQRLARTGYLETQAHLYAGRRYIVRQRLVHAVREAFPKLTERDLPEGLSDLSYALDLHAAPAFRTTEQDMTNSLGVAT